MNNKIIFLSAIIAAFTSCTTLKPLEYRSLENFSVSMISATPELTFDLKLYNPNPVGAKMKDFNLEFFMNGTKLTEVHLDEVVHAGAQSDFSIPINVSTSISQIAGFLPSGINSYNSGKSIPVTMDGSVTMKKFLFHKTFPFHFEESLDMRKIK